MRHMGKLGLFGDEGCLPVDGGGDRFDLGFEAFEGGGLLIGQVTLLGSGLFGQGAGVLDQGGLASLKFAQLFAHVEFSRNEKAAQHLAVRRRGWTRNGRRPTGRVAGQAGGLRLNGANSTESREKAKMRQRFARATPAPCAPAAGGRDDWVRPAHWVRQSWRRGASS